MKVAVKQFAIFFVIGCSAVALDFVVYNYVLEWLCPGCADETNFKKYFLNFNSADLAKAAGFMCGSMYTYYMNKRFTWKKKDRNKVKKCGKQRRLPGFQYAGGDHGGNRVGRIVKAVHEVEHVFLLFTVFRL